ncbi:carbohydrate-binding protein [Flavobacterium algicola]|uniref:carbohydrate-binding protein n=1 Tax=Flavobacterium algicola TaxID=556529 RepID=UPI001EFE938F|nr:carbohydrate-binding protein [Flavobacterium algicola]MCG9792834.1 carbohydrate-binding protein [Flavobacterium algicola]
MKRTTLLLFSCIVTIGMFTNLKAQIVVNNLSDFRTAVLNSNQQITLTAGIYHLEDLPTTSRVINCAGSNNTINLTGVRIKSLVGSIREVYFIISGNNNQVINGAIEDYYQSGLEVVTDFSAYNHDRSNLAYGLRGDPVMSITGNSNVVSGLEMIVKGSFPYGYGSQYGIGSTNTFGLNKRCGILVTGIDGGGVGNTLDGITMYHYAFGHGIFMQSNATETLIKNCYIEGRMRLSDEMYDDTETYDLPYLTNYTFPSGSDFRTLPFKESYPIPYNVMYPLSEDGIRSYTGSGSVVVENCTVKQMRGGIRLYLATSATVSYSTAIDCGETNFNMPNGGTVTGSSGNFSFAPLNDFRLSRSNQDIELTILPSPNAVGSHNIANVQGNNHKITFHRADGPLDTNETRSIVVTGSNSTIINETEYAIILESTASGNKIISCGGGFVTDNGTNNTVTVNDNCENSSPTIECPKTAEMMVGQCYDEMFGVETETSSEGGLNLSFITNSDWVKFNNIDLTAKQSISARTASKYDGGSIEVRLDNLNGTVIATLPVTNRGGWQNWGTDSITIQNQVEGVHDIYFVFKSARSGSIFNVNWFSFESQLLSKNDSNFDNKIGIYPNPATNKLIISLLKSKLQSTVTEVQLYTLKGEKVREISTKNEHDITLDLSNLQRGIYLLKVTNGSEVITKKVVKN